QGDQQAFDLDLEPSPAAVIDLPAASSAVVQRSSSRILLQALEGTYRRLGFGAIDDAVFHDLVVARLVEPTSKRDSIWVLQQLGRDPVHVNMNLPGSVGGSDLTRKTGPHGSTTKVRRRDPGARGPDV